MKTRLASASLLLVLAVVLCGCPKSQSYRFKLTADELRTIQNLQPGQTAQKTFTFTVDPTRVENCCAEGDCCCTCQCDPKPCICTCTDDIIVSDSGADVSQSPLDAPRDRLANRSEASSSGSPACRTRNDE